MANQSTDKALLGYAVSSNTILSKIEAISASTGKSITNIERISVLNFATTQGLSVAISENTKVLVEIKELIKTKTIEANAKVKGSVDMKKILGMAGIIALAGLGIFTLSLAFKEAGDVTAQQIISGIAIFAALVPMVIIIEKLIQNDDGNIFGTPKVIFNFGLTVVAIAGMTYLMAYTMNKLQPVSGEKLIMMLAISAVIYLQGKIFVELIKAWQFSGFIDKYLNKNNTSEITEALIVMAFTTVIIAGAMNLMPNVSINTAAAFVVASAAMIPIAAALVVVRFAMPMMAGVSVKQIRNMGIMMMVMATAMIPIGFAARLLGAIGLTTQHVKNIGMLTAVMIPIAAIVSFVTAIINFKKESMISKSGGGTESLLKQDNSRKRNQGMQLKKIGIWALTTVAILGALALVTVGLVYAAPYISKGITALKTVEYGDLIKLVGFIALTTLLMGGAIALVMKMMRGKDESSTGGGFMRSAFSRKSASKKSVPISTKEAIMAALMIPVLLIALLVSIPIMKAIVGLGIPEIPEGFARFVALTALGLTLFAVVFGLVAITIVKLKMSVKDLAKTAIAFAFISLSVLAAAVAFQLLPSGEIAAPSAEWSLKAGLAIAIFAVGFMLISKYLSKRIDTKAMLKTAAAMGIIALSIIGVAFVFLVLSYVSTFEAPPISWTIKAAVAIAAFAVGFLLIAKAMKRVKMKELVIAGLAIAVIAVSILAVAWVFQYLPDSLGAPVDSTWAIAAAIAITVFAIPLLLIGVIATSGVGAAGILLGAVGVIVIAASIWVVAHIFSTLPDLGAIGENITNLIMAPMNGAVDIFVRIKKEIGIENLIDLALGTLAITGAFGALMAVLAGGGVLASGAGFISGLIDVGTGLVGAAANFVGLGTGKKDQPSGPLALISFLAANANTIKTIGPPLQLIANSLVEIGRYATLTTRATSAFNNFGEKTFKNNLVESSTAISSIAKSYLGIANASKTMNIKAIDSSTRMFEAIADIAKNKGKDAISELATKLMEAVKELSETVKNLEATTGDQQSGMKDAISNAITGIIDKIRGVKDDAEGGQDKGLIDIEPIVLAIQELEERFNRSILVEQAQ